MFKSVYHEACFYFSPFSGFLECVSTLLWRKHLHGLMGVRVFDKSPPAEHPPQKWKFLWLSLPSHQLVIPSPTQEYSHSPSSSYTNLPGYTVIHFSGHFHSITCTHGLETAEQGSLWDISWSQGSEALSCCLAPTVGTLPSKMLYQPASPLISEDNELEVTLRMIHVIFITEKKQNTLSRVW